MVAFVFGLVFALIAQYARLNTFDKIISTVLFRSYDVMQILLFAIAVSSLGFFVEYLLGGAALSVKPFYLVGVSVGGLLFGVGVAILGYCPGTMPMALAEGSVDALFGYGGGILAAAIFTEIYPQILPFRGPDFGAMNLYSSNNIISAIIVIAYASALLAIALKLAPRIGRSQNSP